LRAKARAAQKTRARRRPGRAGGDPGASSGPPEKTDT